MRSWDRRRLVPFGRMSSPGILTGSTDTTTTMLTRSGMPPDFRETYLYSIWSVCLETETTRRGFVDVEECVSDEVGDGLLLFLGEAYLVDGSEERVLGDGLVPYMTHLHRAGEQRDTLLQRHLHNGRLQQLENGERSSEEESRPLIKKSIPEPGEDLNGEALSEERLQPLEQKEIGRDLLRLPRTPFPHSLEDTGRVPDSPHGRVRQTRHNTASQSSTTSQRPLSPTFSE